MIAAIAILASVLIPTFSGVIKKAKLASTQQLLRELNTSLRTETEKHLSMHDAVTCVAKSGFTAESIRKYSNNKIVWNQEDDLFAYYDAEKNKFVYVPENQSTGNKPDYTYWEIVNSIPALNDQKFSLYLAGNVSGNVNVAVGLDVGQNDGITNINYANAENQDIIIRTHANNTNTVIKLESASLGSVTHYGTILGVNNESAMSIVEKGVSDPNYVAIEALSDSATYTRSGVSISLADANAPSFVLQQGDIVIDGDYEYRYKQYILSLDDNDVEWYNKDQEGWGVRYLGTESTPSRMHNSILGKDILYLCHTFHGNLNVINAPEFPSTVIDMTYLFYECTNLETVSTTIPDSVTNLSGAFYNCTNLLVAPVLPASLVQMDSAFNTCENLTITSPYIIPEDVNNMNYAFFRCAKMTGTVEIRSNNLSEANRRCYYSFAGTEQPITLTGTESNSDTLIAIANLYNNITYRH